jgi:hypothetical protein
MKGSKRILCCIIIFAILIGIGGIGFADEGPGGSTSQISDSSSSAANVKYTLEEFDALSDQEKRDVYFNHPQQLPDNYEASKYKDIMHPEQKEQP